jgi:predicted esterase
MKKYKIIPYSDIDQRMGKIYRSYENYLISECVRQYKEREKKWGRDYSSLKAYEKSVEKNRKELLEMMGVSQLWDKRPPVRISEEEFVQEEDNFVVKRIYLNITGEIWTDCLLLIPKKKPGTKYIPLIIQHGYGGSPEAICGFIEDAYLPDYSYHALGARAAEKGYFVIAPHHPSGYGKNEHFVGSVPGYEHYGGAYGKNRLHRLCEMLGMTLFGIDMFGLSRAVDYLEIRKDVDVTRLGIYGLSQGGMSALYFPAMDIRAKASVSSAYFNFRLDKMIKQPNTTSYLDAPEEDKFFPGLLKEFGDSDLVSLICPRAFCAETGKKDGAVWWEDAVKEFNEAKKHYEKLGIPDRIYQVVHEQGHICASEETFNFLDRWLKKGRENADVERKNKPSSGEGNS